MEPSKRMLKPPIKISILEKHESEVSYCWKALMIFSYVIILISGIASSLAIGSIIKMFGNECILYSAPTSVSVINKTISITDATYTYWGEMSYCNFCQFCPVASVIFAGIWGVLFIMCGRGGNADSKYVSLQVLYTYISILVLTNTYVDIYNYTYTYAQLDMYRK